jgi:hypothetical protein
LFDTKQAGSGLVGVEQDGSGQVGSGRRGGRAGAAQPVSGQTGVADAAGRATVTPPPPGMTAVPMKRPERNRGAVPRVAEPLGDDPFGLDPLRSEPPTGAVLGMGVTASPATEAAPGGGRRAREDDDDGLPAASRRSASLEDAEPVRRGRRAAPDDDEPGDDGALRPGDVAAGKIAFWDEDARRHFRAAWHEVKAEFVDDPVTALTRAHDLLTDAVNELTESLLAERDQLDPLRGSATPDTESMRMAMRGYREFLERILAL